MDVEPRIAFEGSMIDVDENYYIGVLSDLEGVVLHIRMDDVEMAKYIALCLSGRFDGVWVVVSDDGEILLECESRGYKRRADARS